MTDPATTAAPVPALAGFTVGVNAARRAAELPHLDEDQVAQAIAARDAKDLAVVDFLTAAPGVTELDSTHLDFAGTVDALVGIVRDARRKSGVQDDALDAVP